MLGSGQGEGLQKKSPDSAWKTGDLPARTLHSLILEDPVVKHIQAGFLTLGSSYSLRLPILPQTQDGGSCKFCPRIQRRGRPPFSLSPRSSGVPSTRFHT